METLVAEILLPVEVRVEVTKRKKPKIRRRIFCDKVKRCVKNLFNGK